MNARDPGRVPPPAAGQGAAPARGQGGPLGDTPGGAADALRADGGCSGGEVFALGVVGHSMAPEFNEGEIIVIEPDGAVRDGSFVLARHDGGWIFRQLVATADGGWCLHALDPAWPDLPIPGLEAVHGVIIQKAVPGRRRLSKRYI